MGITQPSRTPRTGDGAVRDIIALLSPRFKSIANASKSRDGRETLRLVIFGALGLLFMYAAFAGARWLFVRFLEVEFLAELLIRRVLDITLVFFTGLLLFSNLIAGFTTLYLEDDLDLLVSGPIPIGRLYVVRLVQTWTQTSWMMLVFALPILAGCGPVLDTPWWFYIVLPFALLPLTVLCAAIGTWVTMILARWLPAQRMRDFMVVLAVLGFLVLYIAFRFAEPERFLDPEGFADLVSLIGSLKATESTMLPTAWILDVLFAAAKSEVNGLPMVALYSAALGAITVGTWLAKAVYLESFSLAQEGQREGSSRWVNSITKAIGHRSVRYPKTAVDAFVRRDNLIFLRTTSQWTQLLLVGALVVVYLFNFKHFRTLQDSNLLGPIGIFFVNLSLAGLVVTTLGARFLYPAVSLEGRAFWAIAVAPISPGELLTAKVRWGLFPLVILSMVLAIGSGMITGIPHWMIIASILISGMTTWAICGLGVGMGAISPRFHLINPTRIASGIGGVLFMLLGMTYLVATMLCIALPMMGLKQYLGIGHVPSARRLTMIALLVAGALILSAVTHYVPLWLGRQALEKREG